jgi:hypothetical protein
MPTTPAAWHEAIASAETPDAVRRCIWGAPARLATVMRVVASRAWAWDEQLLLAVLSGRTGVPDLVENRSLPAWAWGQIADWCLLRLEQEAELRDLDFERHALQRLQARPEFALHGERAERLLRLANPASMPQAETWRRWLAARVLLVHPRADVALLFQLGTDLPTHARHNLEELVAAPSISPVVLGFLLDAVPDACANQVVRRRLRGSARLRKAPEVRAAMLADARTRQHKQTFRALLDDRAEDFALVLAALHAVSPPEAERAMERHREVLAKMLGEASLASALAHEDAELRLAAIALLGRVRPLAESAPETPIPSGTAPQGGPARRSRGRQA